MGRIRTIKPEILTDEKAASLSHEAWRLWVSMFVLADDSGNLPASPALLGGLVFWAQPADARLALAELEDARLIRIYRIRGEAYATIAGFSRHQKINRPSGAKYPQPDTRDPHGALSESSLTTHSRLTEGSLPSTVDHDRDHDREGEHEGGRLALAARPTASPPNGHRGRKKPKPADPTPVERESAAKVLAKLNQRSGRLFASETHVRRVVRLLRQGHSEQDLRLVVWDRANHWAADEKMAEYLRPVTLFGAEKFPDYLAEAKASWGSREREEAEELEKHEPTAPLLAALWGNGRDS